MANEGPFDPLAGIMTPAELALARQAEISARYVADRTQTRSGQEAGFASLGTLLGQGLEAINGNTDPMQAIAARNQAVLEKANSVGASETDPYQRQATVLKTAADEFRNLGDFTTASKLDTALLTIKKNQLEMRKLDADSRIAETNANALPTEKVVGVNKDIATTENLISETGERSRKAGLPQPKAYFNKDNPSDIQTVDENDPEATKAAIKAGYVPFGGGIGVQAPSLGQLGTQPLPQDARDSINFGLQNLASIDTLESLTGQLKGVITKEGVPNPQAVLDWAGGKIGTNQAATTWNAIQNQMVANTQAIIKGTPSNKDVEIFSRLVPGFWDPQGVKEAKLNLLKTAQKSLIKLTLSEFAYTKQAAPPEIVQAAQAYGIPVAQPPLNPQASIAARDALANSIRNASGAWGAAVASSDNDILQRVLKRNPKPKAQ